MKIANPRRFALILGIIVLALVAVWFFLRSDDFEIDRPPLASETVTATSKAVPLKITTSQNGKELNALLITSEGKASSINGKISLIERDGAVYRFNEKLQCFRKMLTADTQRENKLDKFLVPRKTETQETNYKSIFDSRQVVESYLPTDDSIKYTLTENKDAYLMTWNIARNVSKSKPSTKGIVSIDKRKKYILTASIGNNASSLDHKFEYLKAPKLPKVPDNICK